MTEPNKCCSYNIAMLTCQTLTAWQRSKSSKLFHLKITSQITIKIWQQCYHKSVFFILQLKSYVFQFGQANVHSKDQMMPLPISWLALLKKDKSSILTVALPNWPSWHYVTQYGLPSPQRHPLAEMNKTHRCPTTLVSLSSTEWMVNRSTQEFLAKRRVKPCFLKWSFLSSADGV